ncbi:MAG: hypothetical protein LAO79_13550 [Acidobacteriia bacterium]|nr:hypothetical protein [Terriglobia bacterium]
MKKPFMILVLLLFLASAARPSYISLMRRGGLGTDSITGSLYVTGFVTVYSTSLY